MGCKERDHDNRVSVCDCCVEALASLIKNTFMIGDIIGLTYIEQGVASVAYGTFLKIKGTVVVIDEFLLPGTTSYVPLCKVDSVERGITPAMAASKESLSVSLAKK